MELEQELHHLTMMKNQAQEKISSLLKEISAMNINIDISKFMSSVDEDTRSVSTATGECPQLALHTNNKHTVNIYTNCLVMSLFIIQFKMNLILFT